MGEFPRLQPNGLVEWSSVDAMYAQWPNTLGRGALIVRPGRLLAPLEVLDVVVDVPGEASRTCKAEVVRLEPERAMLRLLDGPLPPLPPPTPATPSPPATPVLLPPPPVLLPPPPEVGELVPRLPVSERSGPTPRAILTPVVEVIAEYDPLPPAATSASPPALQPTTMGLPGLSLPEPSGTWSPPEPAAEPPAVHAPPAPSVAARPASVRFPSGRLVGDPDPFAAVPVAPSADLSVRAASSQMVPVDVVVTPSTGEPPATPNIAPTPSITAVSATSTGMIDAAPLRAAVAPTLSGSVLRFGSPAELQAARSDMLSVGAVLAVGETTGNSVEVALAIAGLETKARVKVSLSAAAPGTLVVQAARRDEWKPLLDEIDSALAAQRSGGVPAAASTANTSGVPAVALHLPPSGTLTNPVTPRGIMMLPLQRPLNEADLKTPSVPLFLRWLRTTRGVFRVELVATQEQQSVTFTVVDGREIRCAVAVGTLGKILAGHVYTYSMTELPRAPTATGSVRTLHLMVEVLRGLLAEHPVDDIAAASPHTRDLRLVRAVAAVADALGLSGPAARVVKSSLQGDDTVAGIVAAAATPRVTWETLVLLELFAGLTFAAGEPVRAPTLAAAATATDVFEGKDHYAVLGLHWSCPPSAISAAHSKARREYGPQGPRRPIDDVLAHKALKRIDEAFSVLGNTDKRHAYRTATYNLAWNQQAQLLVQQAKAAIYRKEVAEARDLLAAAVDLAPTPEAVVLLESLKTL
jgi:hypothetical protein